MSKYPEEELDGLDILEALGIDWRKATRPLEDIQAELACFYRDGVGIAEIEV
jgi:hypothetical protein